MFALLRTLPLSEILARQVPALTVSIIIAETFYKFRSFTLECVAFLVTWLVVDETIEGVASGFARGRSLFRSRHRK